ncbi:MAG: hypothetical protein ACD_37C00663G0002 [uncultured bacterium]|nr:MAG: hypothetical protein ACD_37C00663G0002 [uncultured bacterium]KKQ96808.1 MAG: hypothetical protein UT20_C0002G0002 [Candidatus Levybacteria bacterium GW2011_GWA1_39_11]KKR25122.1 MAG: hypothetical protein UT56_C0003G0046 [Candidatus Levybacteria bacterium GW2011_GWB1_39_7]KKR26281.1 MAG: hypothetical protein UT57_C0037G0006 [Microgenomates group bacterium GW2011_GWC1_39_7]OGH25734.1 MAG: hypothetical protein A3E68_01755 [Candidatus Levybacteria bacterium RIFCSPHIGHO2_12_FULL_39_39]OGH28
MNKFIFYGWIISSVGLLLYSFTQVDLSLTLSQVSVWQTIQKLLQQIGYFNRPLSTLIFLLIMFLMFTLYALTLNFVKNNIFDGRAVWKIIIFVSVILFFAYNAFSYDLFNYIFDAKIVTYYNQNPYEHKALDYPGDPMLSFMHWTHRAYPYGPLWLALTIPLSFIGFGYFLLTFYLFKLLALFGFIWSAILIRKIALRLGSDPVLAVAVFALNPLVLVESLVSAHIDIVMIPFGLLGILAFLEKKYIKSFTALILSIAIKYATVFLIPGIIVYGLFKSSKDFFLYVLILSMIITVVLASSRTNFQPWYLLLVLPFASLVSDKYFILIPVFLISIASLLQYAPFIYLGNWNPPVPTILNWIMISSIMVSGVLIIGRKLMHR